MNAYYESFLRKEIFPQRQDYADLVCDIYDQDPKEKHYIINVLEYYLNGGSTFTAYRQLVQNVISKYQRIKETHSYLDEEYENKLTK